MNLFVLLIGAVICLGPNNELLPGPCGADAGRAMEQAAEAAGRARAPEPHKEPCLVDGKLVRCR